MESRIKAIAAGAIILIAVGGTLLLSNKEMFQGRFDRGPVPQGGGGFSGEPRRGVSGEARRGMSGEARNPNGPDFAVYTGELKPSSSKGYYRVSTLFGNSKNAKGVSADWAVMINGIKSPYMGIKKIDGGDTAAFFDILGTVFCRSSIAKATVSTILDPDEKIAESNEFNNSFYTTFTCKQNPVLTREMAAKLSVIAAGVEDLVDPSTPSFKDVPKSSAFYKYIETAKALGFIDAYFDGSFSPKQSINRAEGAKLIVTALELEAVAGNLMPYFTDNTPSSWSYHYIQTLGYWWTQAEKTQPWKQKSIKDVEYVEGKFNPGEVATIPWFENLLKFY